MDTLPLELKRYIFSYLDAVSLWRCLHVSKSWKEAANDDLMWKKHVKKEGICKYNYSQASADNNFCKNVIIWYDWNAGPLTMWKKETSQCEQFLEKSSKKEDWSPVFVANKQFLAFYSNNKSSINLYTKNGKQKVQLPIDESMPPLTHISKIQLSNKYLFANTAPYGCLIFQKIGNNFVYKLNFVIKDGKITKRSVVDNASNYLLSLGSSHIYLWGNLFLMRRERNEILAFNLNDDTRKKYTHTDLIGLQVFSKKYLAIKGEIDGRISILNKKFKILCEINVREALCPNCVYNIYLNNKVLVLTLMKTLYSFNIKTGELINKRNYSLPIENFLLSEKENVIFLRIQGMQSSSCRIVSDTLNDQRGPLWETRIAGVYRMYAICHKYLLTTTIQNGWHLLDINTGDILYRRTGVILYASDFFSVSRDSEVYFCEYYKQTFSRNKQYIINTYFPKVKL